MQNFARHIVAIMLCSFAVGLGVSSFATADDSRRRPHEPPLPLFQQECSACHVAYPPQLLPSVSWQRIMDNLSNHFGSDASLDVVTAAAISTWLNANGSTDKRMREPPPDDRITQSQWFLREHDEIPAAIWQRPAVRSPANCGACHTQAKKGDFNERNVRIPR
ncbi:MAG TPA: diheme cytochrome c [Steroidobacteraceae bacterium]|nr:diheme cytochrome c [Steroidobacteraceae bacterium]